jgi:hypothetical protein
MTTSILSFGLFFLALALLAAVVLVPIAALAGSVFHAWGTNSTVECLAEAFRRVFTGSLRRRLMHRVNGQSLVNVDGSRQAYRYLAVMVAPDDVNALTGPGGTLSGVASAAANGYIRHARAEGWTGEKATLVVLVADESLRRGNIRVRPVQREEYLELLREMAADEHEVSAAPAPLPAASTRADAHVATQVLTDRDVATALASDPAYAVTMPARFARIVLTDGRGVEHPISTPSVLIGRGRECGVRLDSADVSREHVDVYFQEGTWWLRDLGSRNGTTVDGREVKGVGPVRLAAGTQIVLGGTKAGETLTIASAVEV